VSDSDRPMVRLGGLWRRKSRAGVEYLGGCTLSPTVELMVFKNTKRRSNRDPEYNVVLTERREREPARTSGSPGWSPQSPGPAESHTPRSEPPAPDEPTLPF
jgi:hypothetical protein